MFVSTEFTFDGQKGSDYGLKLVKLENSMFEQVFGYNRDVIFERIPGRRNSIFYNQNYEPLAFKIILSRIHDNPENTKFDDGYRRRLVKWLFKNDFRDFVSIDNPSIVYKIMFVQENKRFNNGVEQGWIELNAFSMYSHAFSPITITNYDFSDLSSPETFEYENHSNVEDYYYPEIQFELKGVAVSFELKNLSDAGRVFKFTGLQTGESIYVDNENKLIETSVPGVYRLDKFNGNYLRFIYGVNQMQISTPCLLQIRSQFPIAL